MKQYNVVHFQRLFFEYFVGKTKNSVDLNTREENEVEIQRIFNINDVILKRIRQFHSAYFYNSIEVGVDNEDNNDENAEPNLFELIIKFESEYKLACMQNQETEYYSKIEFPSGGVSSTVGCGFCLHKKPNRTHHCRQCKACVRKMDHHCFVLSTCIGSSNYKHFLTLFYANFLNIYVLTCSLQSLKFYFNEYQVSIKINKNLITLEFNLLSILYGFYSFSAYNYSFNFHILNIPYGAYKK